MARQRSLAEIIARNPKQALKDILAGRPRSIQQAVNTLQGIIQKNPELVPGYGYAKFMKQKGKEANVAVSGATKSKAAGNIAQSIVETPGQIGYGIYSGATHYLLPRVHTEEQRKEIEPETILGQVGRAYGSLKGFSEGPGRIYYGPLEAPVEQGVARMLGPKAGAIAKALLPGLAAEATSSLPIAALRSFAGKKPFIEPGGKTPIGIPFTGIQVGELPIGGTYPEEVVSGVSSRALFSAVGKAGQKFQEVTGRVKQEGLPSLKGQEGFIRLPGLGQTEEATKTIGESVQNATKQDVLERIKQTQEFRGRRGAMTGEQATNVLQQAQQAQFGEAVKEPEAPPSREGLSEIVAPKKTETIMPKTEEFKAPNDINVISQTANNSFENRPHEVPEFEVQRAITDITLKSQQNEKLPEVMIVKDSEGGVTIRENANYLEAARRMKLSNYPMRDVTSQLGFFRIPGMNAEEMGKLFSGGRPVHQQLLEQSINSKNWYEAKRVLDSIPVDDPYKQPMENLFREKVESHIKGSEFIKQTKDRAKAMVEDFKAQEKPPTNQEGFINLFAPVGKAQQDLQDIKAGVKEAPDPLADTPLGKIRKSIKTELPNVKSGDQDLMMKIKTQMYDRYAPVADLTKTFIESGELKASDDPYIDVRMYAGELNRVSTYLETNYRPILKDLGDDAHKFSEYEALRRIPDLVEKGKELFPGGLKAEDSEQGLAQLREEVGEETWGKFQQAEQTMRNYDRKLLLLLRDAGILSTDDVVRISGSEYFYSPFYRIEYELDQLDRLPIGKKSFNLTNEQLVKGLTKKGSEKDLLDPLQARIRQTSKYIAAADKNMAIAKIAALRNLPEAKGLIMEMAEGDPVPKGYDTISYKVDGVKKSIAVPDYVAESLKGMGQYNADIMTSYARKASAVLRAGATAYNISFMVPNVFRDVTNAAIVHPDGMKVIANWNKGFWSAITKDDYWKAWMAEGGGGTITQEFELTGRPSIESLSGRDLVSRIVSSPKDLIVEIGRISEESTRLAMFRTALQEHPDMDPRYAAFLAREGTVDFSKMGTSMRIINQWVPFLNARTQGTINLGKAWGIGEKFGSEEFNSKFMTAGFATAILVGIPALTTYLWNRKFKDFDDLSRFERDSNFIIILRDRTPQEIERQRSEGKEELIALKIPKGDVGRIFGNPIEYVLRFMDGKKPNELDELFTNVIGEISPVNLPFTRQFFSSATPQLLKPGIETVTNMNLFTGMPIEPEYIQGVPREQVPEYLRAKPSTGPTARLAGQITGRLPIAPISPADIENIVNSTFGGVGRQALQILDIGTSVLTGEKPELPAMGEVPLIERFTAPTGGEERRTGFELRGEAEQEFGIEKLEANTRASELFKDMKDLPPENQQTMLEQLSQTEEPRVINRLENLMGKQEEKMAGTDIYPQETGAQVIMVNKQTEGLDPVAKRQKVNSLWLDGAISEGAYLKLTRPKTPVNQQLEKYEISVYPSFQKIPEGVDKKQFNFLVYLKMEELESEEALMTLPVEEDLETTLKEYYKDLRSKARDAVMEEYGMSYPEKDQSLLRPSPMFAVS
jgi:hypothetical protein